MLRMNNTTITIQIGNSIYNATIASTAPAAAIIKSPVALKHFPMLLIVCSCFLIKVIYKQCVHREKCLQQFFQGFHFGVAVRIPISHADSFAKNSQSIFMVAWQDENKLRPETTTTTSY